MKNKNHNPPHLAEKILGSITKHKDRTSLLGDMGEEYSEIAIGRGSLRAKNWYWIHVLLSLPGYLFFNLKWSIIMFKNYMKITLRNIKREKGYSIINIGGLSIGMACCILIYLYIQFELSYDNFHENIDDIYRIVMHQEGNVYNGSDWWISGPPVLARSIKEDIPEIQNIARFSPERCLVTSKDKISNENNIAFTEPEFFNIFNFPLIKGSSENLSDPYTLLITQKTAEQFFGNDDPSGKILTINNIMDFKIIGVLENIPENSHFKFDFIASFKSLEERDKRNRGYFYEWWNNFHPTYVKLPESVSRKQLENHLPKYSTVTERNKTWSFHLQPLKDIHLNGIGTLKGESDIRYIYIFSITAIFVFLIVCFNYMNLSTARTSERAREVGLRKVVGATRKKLVLQFLGESIFYSLTALVISIVLVYLVLPLYKNILEKNIGFNLFDNSSLMIILGISALVIGIISGSYPAFFLSAFKPILVIKGNLKTDIKSASFFRNSLVVSQFSLSIILMICSIMIYRQLSYISNKNLGFSKEHIITLRINYSDRNLRQNIEPFKTELLKYPNVLDIAVSQFTPLNISPLAQADWEGKDYNDLRSIHLNRVDYNFIEFFGLEIVKGRDFSKRLDNGKVRYILNETAVRNFGFNKPLEKKITIWGREGDIVGVMRDYNFKSLHLNIEPLAFKLEPDDKVRVSIKISSDRIPETISYIGNTWKKFSLNYPFEYSFLEESIDRMYKSEQKIGHLFNYFTVIAIFIACLGLFGLASFMAEKCTKEIGIRKILGASVTGIIYLLSKRLIVLVLLANILSWPLGYYIMSKWLKNFAYRTDFSIGIFIFAGFLALVISSITISRHTYKAANVNPVESLRNE